MFKKTLKQTISGRFWRFFFGSAGPVIAVFLLGRNLWGLSLLYSVLLGLATYATLFFFRFLFFLAKNTISFIHDAYVDSIWGKAIIELNTINSQVQSLRRIDFSNDDFMRTMIVVCERLKVIFDRKTKSNCGVSIKVPVFNDGDAMESLEFRNLCRDNSHNQRDTKVYSETKHTVIGNTAYTAIINKLNNGSRPLAYINNSISTSKDYLNTSKVCYTDGILPYNSELVYPILPMVRGNENPRLLGFICVDCDKDEGFDDSRYDIHVVSGVADSIYDILLRQNNK